MADAAARIVFDHVTKRYPGRASPAVDDLTLTIPAGDICILVGPSGGGKTTAMKMVNRLIDMTDGDIRIGDVSVRDRDVTELRRGIGYVIQQTGLFPHMTVAENVATVPQLLGWNRNRIDGRVDELLDLVDLPAVDYRARYASQLSGGERQRVGLARALAADPPVMLMDEPFGALDPITRTRLQHEFLRIHREVGKTVIFVTHDIDEAILMGDRIAILRPGGRLAQYDTPEAILAHPADDFVADFVGADRGLKRLSLTRLDELPLESHRRRARPGPRGVDHAPRRAVDDAQRGEPRRRGPRRRRHALRRTQPGRPRREALGVTGLVAQSGPVIPDFGKASSCVQENRLFCPDWVRDNWGPVLQPALLQHVKLTVIAVGVGFVLAFAAALVARHRSWFERPFDLFSALVYTIPSLALFQLLVPVTGLTVTTVEVALVSYTLLILFRNILTGFRSVPADVLEAARGMGMGSFQVLRRVELPLALPSIMAGVRIATVSTIALATVAAFVIPEGLGRPIFLALRQFFNTELIVTAILAVGLALVADGLLVLAQRALTPWTRPGARS